MIDNPTRKAWLKISGWIKNNSYIFVILGIVGFIAIVVVGGLYLFSPTAAIDPLQTMFNSGTYQGCVLTLFYIAEARGWEPPTQQEADSVCILMLGVSIENNIYGQLFDG